MKQFHSAIKSTTAALAVLLGLSHLQAQTPLSKEGSPGWYRMRLGRFEVTALSDGTLELPVDKYLTTVGPDRVRSLLSRAYLSNDVKLTVNAFLINTGTKLVLIDTGAGTSQMFGAGVGRLLSTLRASGYSPEQVDEIYITHMHPDHFGGLTHEAKPSFINATVRADRRESGALLDPSRLNDASASGNKAPEGEVAVFRPYILANKFMPFEGRTELVPGITAVPAPGHTSGHTIYLIESQGQKLVLWGDLLQVAAIQFPQPSATFQFDWNATQSARQRRVNYADAAKHGYYAAAAHIAFPGIGKLRAEGDGYRWVPISDILGH